MPPADSGGVPLKDDAMDRSRRKMIAASVSVVTAISLALLKLVVGFTTGSMAVLASAVDSLLDILMSGINFFAIRQAEQPADESHPFGHGKYETLATMIQALVISASGGWIIVESLQRLSRGVVLQQVSGGIVVLAISALVSWWVTRYLRRVSLAVDSSALQADSLHFAMDVYTNLVLMLGLVLLNWFNVPWLDPLLSLLVGLYILFEAFKLVRRSLGDVLDEELPVQVREQILGLIDQHKGDLLDIHNLRTRRAGSQKIMDFHLTVCKHLSVEQAHDLSDHLEQRIQQEIAGADVTIHIEPCQRNDCPGREACQSDPSRHQRR